MPLPNYKVQLGFGDPWSPATIIWETITQYVQGGATTYGTDHELQTIVASTAKLKLTNRDGRFTPWNGASPYAGLGNGLVPDQPVKITVNLGTLYVTPTRTGTATKLSASSTSTATPTHQARSTLPGGTASWVLFGLGATDSTAGSGTEPNPDGKGAVLASPSKITAAKWTIPLRMKGSSTYTVTTMKVRLWKKNGSTYTLIGKLKQTAFFVVTSFATHTFTGTLPAITFGVGTELYMDVASKGRSTGTTLYLSIGASYLQLVPSQAVFYGYVDSWIPKWPDVLGQETTLSCSDAFAQFNVFDMSSSGYEALVAANSPVTYYPLNDLAGSLTAATAVGNTQTATVYGTGATFGSPSMLLCDIGTSLELARSATSTTPTTLGFPTSIFGTHPSNLTFTFWINTVAATEPTFFEYSVVTPTAHGTPTNTPSGWLALAILPTGRLLVTMHSLDTPFANGASTTAINDGHDHMVTVRLANIGGTGTGSISVEVDGVLEETTTALNLRALTTTTVSAYLRGSATFQFSQIAIFDSLVSHTVTAELYQLGSEGFVVQYSGTRIATALKNATWPTSLTSIATGQSQMQASQSTLVGTSLLSYIQSVQTSENGFLFQAPTGVVTFYDRHYPIVNAASAMSQATFEDAEAAQYFYVIDNFTPGLDNLDLWNQIQAATQPGPTFGNVSVPAGATQQYQTVVSQAKYGKRTYSVTGLLVTTDAEALSVAQWLGQLYQTPRQRLRAIQMDSNINNGGDLSQMLGRSLFDRITVIYHGLVGGTPFEQTSVIEGVTHTWDENTWTTTFRLSPAQVQTWFILTATTAHGQLTHGQLAY